MEEFNGDREREDTGVKFTAWGTTLDRFYTGSSDGVVKVWNIQTEENPLVRDLLEVPAPVSYGLFSPNNSRLVVGDASGRVFLLSVDQAEQKPAAFMSLPGIGKTIRRPKPLIPHPEPAAPGFDAQGRPTEPDSGPIRGHAYLETGILQFHKYRDPTIGVVQGPNYALLGLYDKMAHMDGDCSKELLANHESKQQQNVKMHHQQGRRHQCLRAVQESPGLLALHERNISRSLDVKAFSYELMRELLLSGAELDEGDYELSYDEMPSEDEFYGVSG